MTFLYDPPPATRVAPATRPLAWLRRASESQLSSPEAELNSTDFFNIPQILRALPVRDVTRTLLPRFPSGLLWHLRVTRPLRPRAREHQR